MMTKSNSDQMQRLVDALMFAFRINTDSSLVGILGSGSESSNQEALTTWVHETLAKPDLQLAESVLPRLIDRLEELLRNKGEKY
jgi:hypothetical protein